MAARASAGKGACRAAGRACGGSPRRGAHGAQHAQQRPAQPVVQARGRRARRREQPRQRRRIGRVVRAREHPARRRPAAQWRPPDAGLHGLSPRCANLERKCDHEPGRCAVLSYLAAVNPGPRVLRMDRPQEVLTAHPLQALHVIQCKTNPSSGSLQQRVLSTTTEHAVPRTTHRTSQLIVNAASAWPGSPPAGRRPRR